MSGAYDPRPHGSPATENSIGASNRHLWTRFWAVAKPYWFSRDKWTAAGLLVLLILLLLGQTETNVLFNEQSGEFTSALAAKDADRFWISIVKCIYILIVAVPIYAFYYYVRSKLGIRRLFQGQGFLQTQFRYRDRQSGSADDGGHQYVYTTVSIFSVGLHGCTAATHCIQ